MERISAGQTENFTYTRKENSRIKIKRSFQAASYICNLVNAKTKAQVEAVVRMAETQARFMRSTGATVDTSV